MSAASPAAIARYVLDAALPVLLRPEGAVQVGWDPRRATLVRPPDGLTASALADLLRGLQAGLTMADLRAQAHQHGTADPADLAELVGALADAGLLTVDPPRRRRTPSVRIHGRGPLSDLLVAGLRCSGARVGHTRSPKAPAPPEATDLVVLADYLVTEPRVVRDLHNARLAHLPVRVRDGSGLIGPLVFPGRTSCLGCHKGVVLNRTIEDSPDLPPQLHGHCVPQRVAGGIVSYRRCHAATLRLRAGSRCRGNFTVANNRTVKMSDDSAVNRAPAKTSKETTLAEDIYHPVATPQATGESPAPPSESDDTGPSDDSIQARRAALRQRLRSWAADSAEVFRSGMVDSRNRRTANALRRKRPINALRRKRLRALQLKIYAFLFLVGTCALHVNLRRDGVNFPEEDSILRWTWGLCLAFTIAVLAGPSLAKKARAGRRKLHHTPLPIAILLAAVAGVLLIAVSYFVIAKIAGEDKTKPAAPIEISKTAFALVAGIGGAVALVVAYRRQRDTEQGRFVERFGAAAAQLGAEDVAVRIAGVYAMAGVADESPEPRRQQCIDVLCGYLRLPYSRRESHLVERVRHSKEPPLASPDEAGYSDEPVEVDDLFRYRQNDHEVRQTIINTIGFHVRSEGSVYGAAEASWSACKFDFSRVVFDNLDFVDANFDGGVDFFGATFSGVRTYFRNASFGGFLSNFGSAKFESKYTNFQDARFYSDGTLFTASRFEGKYVNFSQAWFGNIRTSFSNVDFASDETIFDGVSFSSTKPVDFSGADFRSAMTSFQRPAAWNASFDWEDTEAGGSRPASVLPTSWPPEITRLPRKAVKWPKRRAMSTETQVKQQSLPRETEPDSTAN